MTYIFHDLAHIILAYLDDLTARYKKFTQHLDDLCVIFHRCRQYNICLNPSSAYFVSPSDTSLGSSFPNVASPSIPSRSNPSPKFHHLRIYANSKAYKAKLTFYASLSTITPLVHMVSFSYCVTIYHYNEMNMPKLILNI
jgi:hypothetical protein